MKEQWIMRTVETRYVIHFKEPLDEFEGITGMSICADRAEIKDEHLILYKKGSVVYFYPIERIDNFYAREV